MPVDLSEDQKIKRELLKEQFGFDWFIEKLKLIAAIYRITSGGELIDLLYEKVESEEI